MDKVENMKKYIKYLLQKMLGLIVDKPVFLKGKTTGYSLVKSEKFNVNVAKNTKIVAPFYMHQVFLGEYSYIAKNCNITNTNIGKFCSIGPNFCCGLGIHPINGVSNSPMFYSTSKQNGVTIAKENKIQESKRTFIGNDVFIGANVTVLDGVIISDGAVIGAGAVVSNNIPPYAIAVGVPAKVIRYRFDNEQIEKLLKIEWWNFEDEKLQEIERYFFDIDSFIEMNNVE